MPRPVPRHAAGEASGVIRNAGPASASAAAGSSDNPFFASPYPLFRVSAASEPTYIAQLDPFGFGASAPHPAGRLQAMHPRYFLLAAKYDLHAGSAAAAPGAASTIQASVVSVCHAHVMMQFILHAILLGRSRCVLWRAAHPLVSPWSSDCL